MGVSAGTLIVLLVLIFNSQMFSATASNPIGIKGLQEAFYAMLAVWATVSIALQIHNNQRVRKVDLFLYLLVILLSTYGAFMAAVQFGQPFWLGLLEERRMIALWVYFPLTTLLRRGWVDLRGFENIVIGIAILCGVLMIGVMAGAVPIINAINQSEISLRGERYGIGQAFVAVAILMLFARNRIATAHFRVASIGFLVGVLLVIVQTRQIILGTLVGLVFLLRGAHAAALVVVGMLAVLAMPYIFPDAFHIAETYTQLIQQAFSEEYLNESWRGLSIGVVLETLSRGEVMGHGALSPTWNDGFASVHGPFFFLSDIGLFGTAYRYGLIGLFGYVLYLVVQVRLLRDIRDQQARVLYTAIFVMVLIMAPLGAPLEYRGFLSGFLLGITYHIGSANNKRPASEVRR